MELEVKFNSLYAELIAKEGNSTMNTGLLDAPERMALAKHLIEIAEELIPSGYELEYEIRDKNADD